MSVVRCPRGDYREGVERIIYFTNGQSPDFVKLLAESTIEDLEDALKVLEKSDYAARRRQKVEAELKIRKMPISPKGSYTWNKWFEEEWNNIRRAAGKKQED